MADELVFAAETADSHRSSLSRRPAASRLRLTPKRLTWRMLGMLMVCWPDSSQCGSLTLLHPCRLLLTKMHVPETYESRKRSFFFYAVLIPSVWRLLRQVFLLRPGSWKLRSLVPGVYLLHIFNLPV